MINNGIQATIILTFIIKIEFFQNYLYSFKINRMLFIKLFINLLNLDYFIVLINLMQNTCNCLISKNCFIPNPS